MNSLSGLKIYFACRSAVEHDGKNGEMGNMEKDCGWKLGMADIRLLGPAEPNPAWPDQ
jgi:hypothetical protein